MGTGVSNMVTPLTPICDVQPKVGKASTVLVSLVNVQHPKQMGLNATTTEMIHAMVSITDEELNNFMLQFLSFFSLKCLA